MYQGDPKLLVRVPVKAKPPTTRVDSFSISPRKIQLRNLKEI